MFRFAHPTYLWLLVLIPVLVVAHVVYSHYKKRQLLSFGDEELVRALMPNASRFRPHIKLAFSLIATTLLIIALARPQYGSNEQTIHRQGIEAMIALDISNSMLAEDIRPNRLDKSKQMLTRIIDNMVDDKVGLVVFAGEAFVQLPITCDYVSAKVFLQNIKPELIQAQGTAIGHAIQCCVRGFGEGETKASRVIILITDGENHEDDAVAAAKAAREKGVLVYVVGIGKPEGALIPDGHGGFKQDRTGQTVVSRLNEDMCKEIAQAGGGVYVRADNAGTATKVLEKELDKLAKADIETTIYTDYNEQFQSFVLIALLLLVVEYFIFSRKNKVMRRINLFSDKRHLSLLFFLLFLGSHTAMAQQDYHDIRVGNRKYRSENYTDAEIRYRKALALNDQSFEAHFNLGDALFRQEKYEEALREYAKAGLTIPEKKRMGEYNKEERARMAEVHHNMGNCYYVAQEYDKAIASYQRALLYNPKDNDTRYNLVQAMRKLQEQQSGQGESEDENENENENQQQSQPQEQQQEQDPPAEPQEPQSDDMDREKAEQILRALQHDEQETQEKAQQPRQSRYRTDKDW